MDGLDVTQNFLSKIKNTISASALSSSESLREELPPWIVHLDAKREK